MTLIPKITINQSHVSHLKNTTMSKNSIIIAIVNEATLKLKIPKQPEKNKKKSNTQSVSCISTQNIRLPSPPLTRMSIRSQSRFQSRLLRIMTQTSEGYIPAMVLHIHESK